jgi:tripartite-type tricarboxylate transporter receptor subunit TctC
MQHVPFKGAGPALTTLIGGEIQLCFASPASSLPAIKSGRLKAIAISGEARLPALPQLVTFTEGGLPDFDVKAWYGFLAPANTPKEVIDRLSSETAKIIAMPDMKEKLAGLGLDPFYVPTDRFAALMRAEMAKHTKIIKSANFKLEN